MPTTNSQLGVSFAPTFEGAQSNSGSAAAAQPQGSIRTLNFRLPQVTGSASANALSPLVSEQAQGSFGGAVLQSVLRTIFGADAGSAFTGQQAPQTTPFAQSQDQGADLFRSLTPPVRPTAAPTGAQPTDVPDFQGDALPGSQTATGPLFDDAGGAPPFENAWASLNSPDEDARRQYDEWLRQGGFQPWVPSRPPNPNIIVDTNPTGGGGRV